ncbi:hypothetical protein UCRNP2_9447 [Neofusicoccum parvum UCRNP2]|uniref:Integral membrane protein n=1 Tax=Botryosphaeria parva (strain UCR-NP2) TaxID=1287680 RepID=R1FXF4_BOTPV|nr:hypothetical protein UCRNP2_9447 [Neofusicoccum parvum UCRNP2]
MIWTELIASTIIGVISWLYMRADIEPSFEFFFFVLVLWVIQIQVLLQIIVNRIGLLLPDARRVCRMKWIVAGYVGIINVSVFCIWLPAQLQRSQTYVNLNHVWDRVEKVLFMLIDAGLNFYFMWLVRRNLIANGLSKYKTLFWANAALDVVSIFLDLAIILSMSFRNPFIYVQFHPLAYTIKLAIEMSLADLIAKVARASSHARLGLDLPTNSYDLPSNPRSSSSNNRQRQQQQQRRARHRNTAALDVLAAGAPVTSEISSSSRKSRADDDMFGIGDGIKKTVAMEVRSEGTPEAEEADGEGGARGGSLDSAYGAADRESMRWLRREGVEEVPRAYIP